jgi:hypothetical protein
MLFDRRYRAALLGALVATTALACDTTPKQSIEVAKFNDVIPPEIQADFQKRVDAYVVAHKQLEAKLPPLPKGATPAQVDRDQRAIGELVVQARSDAKPGDFFTPGMQIFVKALLADVFKGPLGRAAREDVYDEKHPVRAVINKRYPDEVPLSTMPPRVLASLPKLPDELEYRIVYNDLILMDVHAHIILDYVLDAMPPAEKDAPKQ